MKTIKKCGHGVFMCAGFVLSVGCGSGTTSPLAGTDPGGGMSADERPELGPVRGALRLEGGDFVLSLENRGAAAATVTLVLDASTPGARSHAELGERALASGDTLREVIPPSLLEGLSVSSEWLRAELRYRVALATGESGLLLTSLAARNGSAVASRQAVAQDMALPDTLLEGSLPAAAAEGTGSAGLVPRAASTFRACFANPLTFRGTGATGPFINDNLTPNLSADSSSQPMKGQLFHAFYPSTGTSVTASGSLDANGCTPPITRQTSSGNKWKFKLDAYADLNPSFIIAEDSAGSLVSFSQDVVVPATTDPSTSTSPLAVFPDTTEHQQLMVATFLAANTVNRAAKIGVVPPSVSILYVATSVDGNTKYCFTGTAGTGCPTQTTLRVQSTLANDRGVVAHETGHWIHHMFIGSPFTHPYTYGSADFRQFTGVNPSDTDTTCSSRRTSDGTHGFDSIEWQSAAHMEGLADFFQAVAYNSTRYDVTTPGAAQKDCTIYQHFGATQKLNCEAAGRSFSGCAEWQSSIMFGRVGNELDWTRMFWDYLTDYSSSFANLMKAEKNVGSGWPADGKSGNWNLIVDQLHLINATDEAAWRDAPRGNIMDGTPTRSTP